MFDRFVLEQIDLPEVSLRVRRGGSGPPLLLLHGYPQTHMMWGRIADELAKDFTVVAPDLRGYGGSSKPPTTRDHEPYSKRAMARDAVALMERLGFERFNLAGHDRGGRVSYRLALDAPERLIRLSILDIIPTAEVWKRANRTFALGYWHWSFLAQPAPFPEDLMARDPEGVAFQIARYTPKGTFDPEAMADYRQALSDPGVIHAMCEDYRAGATYDVAADEADRGRRIETPLQVLWGAKGALGAWYDVLQIWREWASDVTGEGLDCGHFIPEERPAETLAAFRRFFLA